MYSLLRSYSLELKPQEQPLEHPLEQRWLLLWLPCQKTPHFLGIPLQS
jgi:hypothetical protein